jgi:hypothetical protein
MTGTAAQLQGGAVLEGIREGVQGVSRLIAAGLGELSSGPSPSSIPPSPVTGSTPSQTRAARRRHSTQPSSSSASTFTTNASNSTRLSQSSASSLGDDGALREEGGERDGEGEGEGEREDREEESDVTTVKDTRVTRSMSPNAAVVKQQNSRLSESHFDSGSKERHSLPPSPPMASERTIKIHRRKSRDPPPSAFTSKSFDVSTTASSPTADSARAKQTLKAKRASMSGLPPAASIPGLGSWTAVSGSGGEPVASWVGSVGKKWEEIQLGSTYVLFSSSFILPSEVNLCLLSLYDMIMTDSPTAKDGHLCSSRTCPNP